MRVRVQKLREVSLCEHAVRVFIKCVLVLKDVFVQGCGYPKTLKPGLRTDT